MPMQVKNSSCSDNDPETYQCHMGQNIYVTVNFFFLSVKFYSSFVLGMVIMYDNEVKIKEEQNLTEENN